MADYTLSDLLTLMARLRDPKDGCPWDLKQGWADLVPHTLEEVYEVFDAIDHQNWPHVAEELGDLLFHIVFYSQMATEAQHFDFNTVVQGVVKKLLRRHPHVFPDGTLASRSADGPIDVSTILGRWEEIKDQEKQRDPTAFHSVLSDIPKVLPALQRATKIQKKAAKTGYDWPHAAALFPIIRAELDELERACASGDQSAISDELGDVFFSVTNLARKLDVDAERSVADANHKFSVRLQWIEQQAHNKGIALAALDEEILDEYWHAAKLATAAKTGQ